MTAGPAAGVRRYLQRWSAAEAVLLIAWGAMATGLLAEGLVRGGHLGILLLGAFAAWQMCHVWAVVHRRVA
jgi:hypothetical protein